MRFMTLLSVLCATIAELAIPSVVKQAKMDPSPKSVSEAG